MVQNEVNNLTLEGGITKESYITVPKAALKIELAQDLVRYLFFKTVTDDTINFQSQITDNWVENNTAIQDHITISPVIITMKGLIGEKYYTSEDAQINYEKALAQTNPGGFSLGFNDVDTQMQVESKLSAVSAYFPEVSNATQVAQNMWDLHEAALNKAINIGNILIGQSTSNLQDKMNFYNGLDSNLKESELKKISESLKDYWINRKSFTANTPFGDFDNMYIQAVTIQQGNSGSIGEIDITLKQLRFAQTLTTKANESVLAKYNSYAKAEEQNYGKAGSENSAMYDFLTPGVAYSNR